MSAILEVNVGDQLTLNRLLGDYLLDDSVQGLEIPTIRTSRQVYSGTHGGVIPQQYYSSRVISLSGRVFGDTPSEMMTNRRHLQSVLAPHIDNQTLLEFVFRLYDGSEYCTFCRLTEFTCPIMRTKETCPFSMVIEAPDPLLYDLNSNNLAHFITGAAGGYDFPYNLPANWEQGGGETEIDNVGSIGTRPTITLRGNHNQNNNSRFVEVSNATTSQKIRLETAMISGDVIVIDFRDRTILRTRGTTTSSIISTLDTAESDWWQLNVGANTLRLLSNNDNDTITANIAWQTAYVGV